MGHKRPITANRGPADDLNVQNACARADEGRLCQYAYTSADHDTEILDNIYVLQLVAIQNIRIKDMVLGCTSW